MADRLAELEQALFTGEREDVEKVLRREPSASADTVGAAHFVLLRHLARHVIADHSSFSGIRVADFANGLNDAFFADDDRRTKSLAGSIGICLGPAPFAQHGRRRTQIAGTIDGIDRSLREAAQGNDWEACEGCLRTLFEMEGTKPVLGRLWTMVTEPFLLGHHRAEFVGNLADLFALFGDANQPVAHQATDDLTTIVCNLGARLVSRHPADFSGRQHEPPYRGFTPEQELVSYLEGQFERLNATSLSQGASGESGFDQGAFLQVLRQNEPMEMFRAITSALDDGVSVQTLYENLTINSLHRIVRGPATGAHRSGFWARIKRGLLASADVRKCLKSSTPQIAARVLYHAAYQCTFRPDADLGEMPNLTPGETAIDKPTVFLLRIAEAMREARVAEVTNLTLQYLEQGLPGEELLRCLRRATADKSCGQRTLVDTWYEFQDKPEQNLVLIAMARWGAFA